MLSHFRNPYLAGQGEPHDSLPPAADRDAAQRLASLRPASRACCCPARPAVIAVLPSARGRAHPTDLLLCRHHCQVHRRALEAAGATIIDADVVTWPANRYGTRVTVF